MEKIIVVLVVGVFLAFACYQLKTYFDLKRDLAGMKAAVDKMKKER